MRDPLFEPIDIAGLRLKNRIYMPPMHLGMTPEFEVTDQFTAFYVERARGGVAAISVGYATVNDMAGQFACLGAHDDRFIPGLARLAKAIRENGAAAIVQLNHAGRQTHSMLIGGRRPVAPSDIPSPLTKETPRPLEVGEIEAIVEDFAQSARRVQEAGYDAVEVITGTGYLISQFLSPISNTRTDEYGGSFENRMRFGLQVMRAVKQATGGDFPLIARLNGNEFMPGGNGRRELQEWARCLVEAGVNALSINQGWHEARVPLIVAEVPRGTYGYLARGIKEQVSVPVIAGHRINDPMLAREMIGDGICDMTAMGRGLIADPELPDKAATGREGEIIHCVACAQGCFDHIIKGQAVGCLCNPRAGRELETEVVSAAERKKIMVVGGGAAGMSAAAAAADRGHDVVLYESSSRLGGQLHLAGSPPGREEFTQLADDLARQVALKGVQVRLGREADQALIAQESPDAVIVATGARPVAPSIPGIDLAHVVQAWDVLDGRMYTGRRVVVVGGGAVGVETALFLADKGTLSGDVLKFLLVHEAESAEDLYELATRGAKEVTLIEMMDKIGKDFGKTTRWVMLQDLEKTGINVLPGTRLLQITEEGVEVEDAAGSRVLPADTVVLALGATPYNPLADALEKQGTPFEVVGDAADIARAYEAIHQGFEAGNRI